MNIIKQVFEGQEVRIKDQNGEPWFVLKDVCDILGHSNPTQAIKDAEIDAEDRAKLNLGRQGETNIINESGLYDLILSSRKEGAKKFKKWITKEVLPAIRKTGKYEGTTLRDKTKKIRVQFTDALKECGCSAPYHFINITNKMKSGVGIDLKTKKDKMTRIELAKIGASEFIAEANLLQQQPVGYFGCLPVCEDAAQAVKIATTDRRKELIEKCFAEIG